MGTEWYYAKDQTQHGPVELDELKALAVSGELRPSDTVWNEGMAGWLPAEQVDGLLPPKKAGPPPIPAKAVPPPLQPKINTAPPPIPAKSGPPPLRPTSSASPVIQTPVAVPPSASFFDKANAASANLGQNLKPEHRTKLMLAYRIALVIAIIAAFCPWLNASSSGSFMGNSSSASISISGTETNWGTIGLLVGIAGLVLSFINPAAFLKEKTKLTMAGAGVLIVLSALVVLLRASHYFGRGSNYSDSYGNSSHSSSGVSFGLYLCIVGGLVAAVVGFLHDWKKYSGAHFTPLPS